MHSPDHVTEDVYFMRRLRSSRQAQRFSGRQHAILAADSNLDDDLHEQAVAAGGGPEFGKSGWGMSEMFTELLSREPKSVKTEDVSQLQRNLVSQGYIDPKTPVDGIWSPQWGSAFRRFDRDNEEVVRAGKHWLSAPVTTGVRTLSYVLPSRVFQGIVGTARGLVEQVPESTERLGLAGGAVAGAAIGTAIAPGLGSLIGGAVGGIAGFAADFFGDEEGEDEDRTSDFIDALSPWEEYKAQGSKAFFEDLGLVLTVASAVRGGSMAVSGVRAGMQQIGLRGALTKAVPTQPGIISRVIGGGLNKVSSSASETWINVAKTHGLLAQTSRPLLQTVNGGFRGLAAGQVGARLAGGLGSGEEKTTIERNIEEAPLPPHAELLDNTVGLFMFSDKFLPLETGSIAKGAKAAMTVPIGKLFGPGPLSGTEVNNYIESGVALKPYIHVAQRRGPDGSVLSHGKAREAAKKVLGRDNLERAQTDLWLRVEFGVHRRAGEMLADIPGIENAIEREKLWQDALFDVKRRLRGEWDEGNNDLTRDLIRYSHMDPTDTANGEMSFAGFLQGLDGFGSSIDRMERFRWANKRVGQLMHDMDAGRLSIQVKEGLEGTVQDVRKTFRDFPTNFEGKAMRRQAKALETQAAAIEKKATRSINFQDQERLLGEAAGIKTQADELRAQIPTAKKPQRRRPFTVTVARKADEAAGVPGYSTEQDILGFADEYDRRAQALTSSFKAWQEGAGPATEKAYKLAQEEMTQFSQSMFQRGLVTDKDLELMRRVEPHASVSDRLRKRAAFHAKEVVVDPNIAKEFDDAGYRLIATRDDVLMFDELDKARQTLELQGVGDYTRRAAFFETLGVSPWKHTDRSLFALRRGHEDSELQQVLAENGIKMTGKQAMRKIHDYMNEVKNGKGVMLGPWIIKEEAPSWVKKFQLYRVDVRELSPDDLAQALELDTIAPKTVELMEDVVKVTPNGDPYEIANKLHDAMRRGASLGGEADFRHPVDAARMLAKALRVNGLPGFSDFMRTFDIPKAVLRGAGAIGGAAVGAELGSRVGGVPGAVGGAILGGTAGGLTGPKFPQNMPDHLHRLNMALRYSLSPFFDAGRYMEQNMLGMTKAGLPAIVAPRKYITRHYGESAWREAVDLWDEVNGFKKGKGMLRVVDDTDRRMFQRGMLGFSPRYHEAAQMYLLKKQGMSNSQIEDTISQIGRYGVGRTAAEKSVNFIFFPASFQKKLVTTLGDFVLQAPGRALMLHEGTKRFWALDESYQEGADSPGKRVAEFLEDKVPFAQQVARLNNLSYGLSPGRFFLQGLGDNATDTGKAAQILASFFVPSGAATPVAQSFGGLGDAAMQFFVPTAVAGEEVEGLDDILNQYIPIVRDLDNLWQSSGEQLTAITEGGAPYSQLQDYQDEKRTLRSEFEPIAMAMGYASVDGFLQSDVGQLMAADLAEKEGELGQKYPAAIRLIDTFDRDASTNKQALFDLANRTQRSPEEEDIVKMLEMEEMGKLLHETLGDASPGAGTLNQSEIRRFALERADNKRFVALYERFFGDTYGPIRRVAA